MPGALDHIRSAGDIARSDGKRVVATGVYREASRPVRGAANRTDPKDRATLLLADGTVLWLEALDSPKSQRAETERTKFAGKRVSVRGIAHRVMPSHGESLVAPCISDIEDISDATE